jgi:hypothetical protein
MGTGANLVSLAKPSSELVVQLVEAIDAEVMDVQPLGVSTGSRDSGILYATRQVKVSAQRAFTELGSGESPPSAF